MFQDWLLASDEQEVKNREIKVIPFSFKLTELWSTLIQNNLHTITQYNLLLRIERNLLVTRVIIKIESHPCYPINADWFSWGWSKKKLKMADSKKLRFSSPPILNFFSRKFYRLVLPWVGTINWCNGHQCGSIYVVVKLSDISSKKG